MKQLTVAFISVTLWLINVIYQAFLYFNVSANGMSYMPSPGLYFSKAIFYSATLFGALTIPFLVLSFVKKIRIKPLAWVQMIILFLYTFVIIADHEFMRFTGAHFPVHVTSFYDTLLSQIGQGFDSMAKDARFPYSSLVMELLPIGWFVLMVRFRKKWMGFDTLTSKLSIRWQRVVAALCVLAFLGLLGAGIGSFIKRSDVDNSIEVWASRPQKKVSPLPIAIADELQRYGRDTSNHDYTNISNDIKTVREMWQNANPDPAWQFVEGDMPLLKHYTGNCALPDGVSRPNFLFILSESARAWNFQILNPNAPSEAMPYLRSIIEGNDPIMKKNNFKVAYYTWYHTNGQPTIDALIPLHTSLVPHSRYRVASIYATNNLHSFVEELRDNGYESLFIEFGEGVDNTALWLQRWYDKIIEIDDSDDKYIYDTFLHNIREYRKINKPYFIMAQTITNHEPFNMTLPESPDIYKTTKDMPITERIQKTMAYTDNEFKLFMETLDRENMLDNTVVIVVGDHALDLGEFHDPSHPETGNNALKTNVTWVPLVIMSNTAKTIEGRFDTPVSHVDIAPTILDFAGICGDNSYFGHSLMNLKPHTAFNCKAGNYAVFNDKNTAIFIQNESPQLYTRTDVLEQKDIHEEHTDLVESMRKEGQIIRTVFDYGYNKNLF